MRLLTCLSCLTLLYLFRLYRHISTLPASIFAERYFASCLLTLILPRDEAHEEMLDRYLCALCLRRYFSHHVVALIIY